MKRDSRRARERGSGAFRPGEGQRSRLPAGWSRSALPSPSSLHREADAGQEAEEEGIGRPSTYAAILSVIQNRDYVVKADGKFRPTELGEIVVDLLVESFHGSSTPASRPRWKPS